MQTHPTRAQQGVTYVPKDLFESSYVSIRDDRVRKPLQQPYKGPFKVLKCNEKFFTVDIGGKRNQVSVDRLKVAHVEERIDNDETTEVNTPKALSPANTAGSSAANAAEKRNRIEAGERKRNQIAEDWGNDG